jgi:large subunit ribosomal protein L25
MAEKVIIKASRRDSRGKNENRRLRASGKVPVVVYGGGSESLAATAELKELAAILRSDSGINTVFSLDIEGEGVNDVIFQDRQIDPLRGRLMHADLRRFARGEKIEMTVPLHLIGEPIGLQEEGNAMMQSMREVKVLCEPAKTPEFIELDVSGLESGSSLQVSDLSVDDGIEIVDSPDAVIVSVAIAKEVSLEPQIEDGAQPEVEGEAPAEGSDDPAEGGI